MPPLPVLSCPSCSGQMIDRSNSNGRAYPRAGRFEDCVRQCAICQVGASNSSDPASVTYIYREPSRNVPAEMREGVTKALDEAFNIRNRPSKRVRFGFSTSEDAVTWVVFGYLFRSRQLCSAFEQLGFAKKGFKGEPSLLLWGSPLSDPAGVDIRDALLSLCAGLGEDPQSFSEPDVIVDFGEQGLIFVEVKYLSGNDSKEPGYPGWSRYMPAADLTWNETAVRSTGCYELARNWRLVTALSNGRPATLINLGPSSLFYGSEGRRLEAFGDALSARDPFRFARVSWADFLSAIPERPAWFLDFCRGRNLLA